MYKLLIRKAITFLLCFLCLTATSQNIPIGKSVISGGINVCNYNASAKNLCTLFANHGFMAGMSYCGTYNYGVLKKITLTGEAAFTSYTVGTSGYQAGVGCEYDFKLTHRRDPVDIYLSIVGGYARISYKGSLIVLTEKLTAPGIFYQTVAGIRRHIAHHIGIFANINYVSYTYSGGEAITTDSRKTPYTLFFSGFSYGGGLYIMIGPDQTTPLE